VTTVYAAKVLAEEVLEERDHFDERPGFRCVACTQQRSLWEVGRFDDGHVSILACPGDAQVRPGGSRADLRVETSQEVVSSVAMVPFVRSRALPTTRAGPSR
jgi:hypothetical protein